MLITLQNPSFLSTATITNTSTKLANSLQFMLVTGQFDYNLDELDYNQFDFDNVAETFETYKIAKLADIVDNYHSSLETLMEKIDNEDANFNSIAWNDDESERFMLPDALKEYRELEERKDKAFNLLCDLQNCL